MDAICLVCESAFGVEGSITSTLQLECPNCQMGILMVDDLADAPPSKQLFEPLPENVMDDEGAAILDMDVTIPEVDTITSSAETTPPRSRGLVTKNRDAFGDLQQAAELLSPISEALHAPEDLTRTLPNIKAINAPAGLLDGLNSSKPKANDTVEAEPEPKMEHLDVEDSAGLLSDGQDTVDNAVFAATKPNSDALDLSLQLDAKDDDVILTTLPVSEIELDDEPEDEEDTEVVLATLPSLLDEPDLLSEELNASLDTLVDDDKKESVKEPKPELEPVKTEAEEKSTKSPDPTLDLLALQLDSALTSSLMSDPVFTKKEESKPEPTKEEAASPALATTPVEDIPEVEEDPGEISMVETLTPSDILEEPTASTEILLSSDILMSGDDAPAVQEKSPKFSMAPPSKEEVKPPPPPKRSEDSKESDDLDLEVAAPVVVSLEKGKDPLNQTLDFFSTETVREFVEKKEEEKPTKPVPPPRPPKSVTEEGVLSEPPHVDFDAFSQEFFEADVKEPGTEHEAELIALLQQQRDESRRIIRRIMIFAPILLIFVLGMFWSINYLMTQPKQNDNTNASVVTKRTPTPRRIERRLPPIPSKSVGVASTVDGGAPVARVVDADGGPAPRTDVRPDPRVDTRPTPRTDTRAKPLALNPSAVDRRQPVPVQPSKAELRKKQKAAKARVAEKLRLLAEKQRLIALKKKQESAKKKQARAKKKADRKAKRAAKIAAKRAARAAAREAAKLRRAERKKKRQETSKRRAEARKQKRQASAKKRAERKKKRRQKSAKRKANRKKSRQASAKKRAERKKKRQAAAKVAAKTKKRRVAKVAKRAKPKRDPAAAKKFYQKGMRAFLGGNLKAAERDLKRSIRANPGLADAHRVLGMTYMRLQKKSKARRHLKAFLRLAPGHPIAGMIKNLIKNLK